MKIKPISEITALLAPIAAECGAEILEVKWDDRTKALNVWLDAPGGVDFALLEKFNQEISDPLDELDPTFGAAYTLNCSSAGLDRPFKTARDYERHMGEKVEIHLYAPIGGKKYYEGELTGFDGKEVSISAEEGERSFPIEKVAKCCLFIDV